MTELSLVTSSLGLLVNIVGSAFLYKGTWGFEPEPTLSISELSEAVSQYATMQMIQKNIAPGREASEFHNSTVNDALLGPKRRNEKRQLLNRIGFILLMVGFVFQLVALWVTR
jgi:hypothetical protein